MKKSGVTLGFNVRNINSLVQNDAMSSHKPKIIYMGLDVPLALYYSTQSIEGFLVGKCYV